MCWTLFADEIFEGEGEYQYDVYRMMREHNKNEWAKFNPLTNVMVSFESIYTCILVVTLLTVFCYLVVALPL